MQEQNPSLEKRVEGLAAQLQALTLRVEQLSKRLEMPDAAGAVVHRGSHSTATPPLVEEYPLGAPTDVSEEILSWAGKAALLPRLATLCFLLVIALGLRTITDNNIINTFAGSVLGMSYATVLMLTGWYMYDKRSPLAPVFAACGAVLICTIVVETHTRFAALPLVPAYLTLMATGMMMAVVSYNYNVFLPVSVGILGMCLAGMAIDYPNPFFPYLAMVLLTANILGHVASMIKRCAWLRWIILAVTMFMLHLWGLRLGMTLFRGGTPSPTLALEWFLPVLAVYALTYMVIALLGILRSGVGRVSGFYFSLPTISVAWAFSAALYVVSAWGENRFLLGAVGVAGAMVQLAVAFRLAGRNVEGAPGVNSFVFAGATLMALALQEATGRFILSLPLLSCLALFLAVISRQWQNGGVRVTSYILQTYVCVALAVMLQGSSGSAVKLFNIIPAGIIAIVTLIHYQWCRKWPHPSGSAFHKRFDPDDRSAALLLLAALISVFFALRIGIYHAMPLIPGEAQNSSRCAQSALINFAAAGLMLLAFMRRNKELRNVAILVTLVGAIKVSFYDLLGNVHGVPLVLSVFSFGLAAALESVALGRWQREAPQGGMSTGEKPVQPAP
ncbi:MAG: hypothetical protein WA140_06175 [Geobacteraceae bacterium]